MLDAHHARNCPPRAPDLQGRQRHASTPSITASPPSSSSKPPASDKPSSIQRAPRNSVNPPTKENATHRMLRYYGPVLQDLLRRAKRRYIIWLLTENPYPGLEVANKEATACLEEVVREFKGRGDRFADGMYLFSCLLE